MAEAETLPPTTEAIEALFFKTLQKLTDSGNPMQFNAEFKEWQMHGGGFMCFQEDLNWFVDSGYMKMNPDGSVVPTEEGIAAVEGETELVHQERMR